MDPCGHKLQIGRKYGKFLPNSPATATLSSAIISFVFKITFYVLSGIRNMVRYNMECGGKNRIRQLKMHQN